MKLTELVAHEQANNPKLKDKTTDEVANILYSQVSRSLHDERVAHAKTKAKLTDPVTIEISGNELQLKKSHFDKTLKMQSDLRRTLAKTDVIRDLGNLIKPILDVSKAIYQSGTMINSVPLHELDSKQKPTKNLLRNEDNEVVFNTDAVSQLKAVLYVLEHNEQAKQALAMLRDALTEYSPSAMKELEVTKKTLDSPVPSEPKFRGKGPTASQKLEAKMAKAHQKWDEDDQAKQDSKDGQSRV